VVLSISINITGNVIMSPTLYSHIDQHSPYLKSSLPTSVFFFVFLFFPCCFFFFFPHKVTNTCLGSNLGTSTERLLSTFAYSSFENHSWNLNRIIHSPLGSQSITCMSSCLYRQWQMQEK